MSNDFQKQVKIAATANYGAVRGDDGIFYKPVNKSIVLEVGQTYNLKGYTAASGKTHYVTGIVLGDHGEKKPAGRKLSPPKSIEPDVEVEIPLAPKVTAGDNKGFTFGRDNVPKRDFVKEAKGKTFSLIVAGLAKRDGLDVDTLLSMADQLLKGIEERGYF